MNLLKDLENVGAVGFDTPDHTLGTSSSRVRSSINETDGNVVRFSGSRAPKKAAPSSNSFSICGFHVHFPLGKTPFPSQFAVMSKVLLALNKGDNALLESPTGTGKTLALLCSALSWQQRRRINVGVSESMDTSQKAKKNLKKEPRSRVYFASRTHSQISQVACHILILPFTVSPRLFASYVPASSTPI